MTYSLHSSQVSLSSTSEIDTLISFEGCAIAWDDEFNTQTEGQVFASAIEFAMNCACFIYIGAWLSFETFTIREAGLTPVKLLIFSMGVVFLRRIPALLALYKFIPEIASWKQALFSGHFGISSSIVQKTTPLMQ